MKQISQLIVLLIFCLLAINAFSQEADIAEEDKRFFSKPNKYNLTFRLDYSLSQLSINHGFRYEGERYSQATDQFSWITLDSTLINFDKLANDVNLKFDLLISTVEPLSIGLTYHLLVLKTESETSIFDGFDYDVFLGLGAIIDYRWNIPNVKGVIINPAITLGYYIGSDEFSGKGREAYYNFKLAGLYNLWDKLDVRAYTDYTIWRYKEDNLSTVFTDKNKVVKSNINHLNFGLGLAYRFHLVPD